MLHKSLPVATFTSVYSLLFSLQVASGQLLRSSEEVDEINALREFGKRIEPIKHHKDLLEAQSTLEKTREPITALDVTPKKKSTLKRKVKIEKRRRKPVDAVDVKQTEDAEIMVPAESGRGLSRFGDDLADQSVDVVAQQRRRKGGKRRDDSNVMEFKRRGQRQSHMEEMAHAHIEKLSVECGPGGISVSLAFSDRFDGVVYSKGFFNDPQCT